MRTSNSPFRNASIADNSARENVSASVTASGTPFPGSNGVGLFEISMRLLGD